MNPSKSQEGSSAGREGSWVMTPWTIPCSRVFVLHTCALTHQMMAAARGWDLTGQWLDLVWQILCHCAVADVKVQNIPAKRTGFHWAKYQTPNEYLPSAKCHKMPFSDNFFSTPLSRCKQLKRNNLKILS